MRNRGGNGFLKRFNEQYGKSIRELSPETVIRLVRYYWPGNIRELESVIERAVLFCSGTELLPNCLPEEFQTRATSSSFVIPPLLPIVNEP